MIACAVIGLGFGDEGKGAVTEYLCSKDPINTGVVRFSGGHQCGHTVVKGDIRHVFASFGSGTLSGCPTYWSRFCTFEPVGFWTEYAILREKGITPNISIHPECPVTTPYDVFVNRQSIEMVHGTTGTGFFRTLKRHVTDNVELTVKDFFNGTQESVLEKLDCIRFHFGFRDYTRVSELNVKLFQEARSRIKQLVGNVRCDHWFPCTYTKLVFEGSQGLLLDERIGDFPHVTPSDVTPRNVLTMVETINEIYLVSRVYQTRHGNGPLTNTEYPLNLVNTKYETNKYNRYQGEFRIAILDLNRLMYAKTEGIAKIVSNSTRINLVMTCADQVDLYKVSVDGEIITFHDVNKFIRFIGEHLGVNGKLYVNTSSHSTSIKMVGSLNGNE